jgi:hypothetical protein
MMQKEIETYKETYVAGESVFESASLFGRCFFFWVTPAMKVGGC